MRRFAFLAALMFAGPVSAAELPLAVAPCASAVAELNARFTRSNGEAVEARCLATFDAIAKQNVNSPVLTTCSSYLIAASRLGNKAVRLDGEYAMSVEGLRMARRDFLEAERQCRSG